MSRKSSRMADGPAAFDLQARIQANYQVLLSHHEYDEGYAIFRQQLDDAKERNKAAKVLQELDQDRPALKMKQNSYPWSQTKRARLESPQ